MHRMRSGSAAFGLAIVALVSLSVAAAAQAPQPAGDTPPVLLPLVTTANPTAGDPKTAPTPEDDAHRLPDPSAEAPQSDAGSVQPPPADSPDARYWDSDNPLWADTGMVETAATSAVAWDIVGNFTVSSRLGVGTDPPTYVGDFRRTTNAISQIRITNPNQDVNAGAAVVAATNVGAVSLQVHGQNFGGVWNDLLMRNFAMLRSDTALGGLVITTGGSDPLILGVNNRRYVQFNNSGEMRLYSPLSTDFGAKLNFGNANNVYLSEPADNDLEIRGLDEINLKSERLEVNGVKPIQIIRMEDINDNRSTGVRVADWSCVVASWSASFDIDESETDHNAIWVYDVNGIWWVRANLNSHINNDFPDVDLLCFRNELVTYTGDKMLWDPD